MTRREPFWPIVAALWGPFLMLATCAPEPTRAQDAHCAAIASLPGAVTIALGHGSASADTVTLAPHDLHVAQVCYWNSAAHASRSGPFEIEAFGVLVRGAIEIGTDERIVIAPPEGLMVLPYDTQDVPDGGGVVFYLAEVKV